MVIPLLLGLYILVIVGLPIGLAYLLYYVPKRLGYPRIGKYLVSISSFLIVLLVLWLVFEDQLFTKNKAKELVEEQQILLLDKFELVNNESSIAIGEYYHIFTLKISERDKQNAISKIKSSDNFISDKSLIDQMQYFSRNGYFGPKVTQNYETENSYVREFFQPSGKEGYAPTFRRISISKTNNELTFEEIDE